jgi:hypothetical protein
MQDCKGRNAKIRNERRVIDRSRFKLRLGLDRSRRANVKLISALLDLLYQLDKLIQVGSNFRLLEGVLLLLLERGSPLW